MTDREKVIKALELCTSKIETRTQLNQQIMGRLDAYEQIIKSMLKLLIDAVKEGR